jgi:hypothetical protein
MAVLSGGRSPAASEPATGEGPCRSLDEWVGELGGRLFRASPTPRTPTATSGASESTFVPGLFRGSCHFPLWPALASCAGCGATAGFGGGMVGTAGGLAGTAAGFAGGTVGGKIGPGGFAGAKGEAAGALENGEVVPEGTEGGGLGAGSDGVEAPGGLAGPNEGWRHAAPPGKEGVLTLPAGEEMTEVVDGRPSGPPGAAAGF